MAYLTGSVEGGLSFIGGGSDVSITPALQSGTKVADYTIDNVSGSLYAPTPPAAVNITPVLESGTKIADYTIGNVSGSLYAPEGGSGGSTVTITPSVATGTKIADYIIDGVAGSLYTPTPPEEVTITPVLQTGTKIAAYQKGNNTLDLYAPTPPDAVTITPTVATGTKIADYTIGNVSGSLYAPESSGGIDYSLTEQDTGLKWVDGKTIYQKTYYQATPAFASQINKINVGSDNYETVIDIEGTVTCTGSNYVRQANIQKSSIAANDCIGCYYNQGTTELWTVWGSAVGTASNMYITVRYTKSST